MELDYKYAVIEREDGSTFVQKYLEFEDLINLYYMLGPDYFIVDIY